MDTGLEYPEIRKFVPSFADWLRTTYRIPVTLEVLRPEMTFPEVISEYGYPVIGKEIARRVYYAKRGSTWAANQLKGLTCDGKENNAYSNRFLKYNYLIEAPFAISSQCCDVMKKGPRTATPKNPGESP